MIVVDAGIMLGINNGGGDITAKEHSLRLVEICFDAEIPVYITGAGLEIVCLEKSIVERVKGVYLETHRTRKLWYDACMLSRVAPCDALYVSARKNERAAASAMFMVPVAVADPIVNRLGYCFDTALHTRPGYIFTNLKLFVEGLEEVVTASNRRVHTRYPALA
ncbi:hypothetical protein A3C89_02350 [Candidatus Kaiserbacteria bacterium RIFCSPHIGHO2_02_FULL_50_50]|uniref:Uncharacterized protein n=1 Tax=Candidatus Kaiserbacteria bacterium RIFCSPHIGHO2_02_FULL_50_50 TaxID=1798492 RepID=A0A1F6DGD7_9BACT|nr:MAG: hypothetical protein A3C89_02350 [Candidatus Kaiserbacteria bacterium RIFCSPHIGHO2_02_FULL_50_50]OGG88280.1 MAG: hypothetical protein A3G62_02550 [Candidatus Kaiserbacteria bacterium RIFCSPLOWO2_12_FULL_50_10]